MASNDDGTMLVVGNQRSYSDVCRNTIVRKSKAGIIVRCYAGTTLYHIIKATGLAPPVTPGTGWATVGGCIANDVHGKNHCKYGSFGNHVERLKLLRSDGEKICSLGDSLFAATVGGLGLTGEIVWAELGLVPHAPLPWLFPLDYIPWYWPIYKRLGFWQYHCVIPEWAFKPLMRQVTQRPLLLVKKRFGNIPTIGMLSFCQPGLSVAMDFARKSDKMKAALDAVVMHYGGALYPAKTSMSAAIFKRSFPRWQEFAKYVDPKFSSDFWRRVSA